MATQETIKQMRVSENGPLRDLEDTTARAAIAMLQSALDAITNGDSTAQVIDTFNEVVAFLANTSDSSTLQGIIAGLNTAIAAKYTKPETGIPATDLAQAVQTILNSVANKANSADVYTKSQTYSKSEVNAAVADAGKVKSVTINGTKKTPNETTGDVDLGTIVGQQGQKGDTGNVEITDAGDLVTILVNDLTTGGAGNLLSAEMGKRLKEQVDYVYGRVQAMFSLFSNAAFWDGKPQQSALLPDLDWSNPKHTITLGLSLTNAVVKRNGVPVSNGETILAEEFSTLTFIVEPSSSSYALTSVTSSTTGATVTDNGNGTYTVTFVVGQSNATLAINAQAAAARTITYNLTHCDATTKPTSVLDGGSATIVFQADTDYTMPSSLPSGAVTNASVTSYTRDANDDTKATLVIGNVTGNVTIAVAASGAYVENGLVFRLDGKNRGGVTGHWKDTIGQIDFALTDCTENTDHVVFNGSSSKGIAANGSLASMLAANCTIECVFELNGLSSPAPLLINPTNKGIGAHCWQNSDVNAFVTSFYGLSSGGDNILNHIKLNSTKNQTSVSAAKIGHNGNVSDPTTELYDFSFYGFDGSTMLAIGYRHRGSGDNYLAGKIYEIRIYNRTLSQAEIAQNYAADVAKYNL